MSRHGRPRHDTWAGARTPWAGHGVAPNWARGAAAVGAHQDLCKVSVAVMHRTSPGAAESPCSDALTLFLSSTSTLTLALRISYFCIPLSLGSVEIHSQPPTSHPKNALIVDLQVFRQINHFQSFCLHKPLKTHKTVCELRAAYKK